MEDPRSQAKKLVRREVTRVVTPGTAADSSLGSDENNFLAALAQFGDRVGFAALDLSTGEFRATEFAGDNALRRVQEELEQLRPKELLYGSAAPLFESVGARAGDQPSFTRSDGRGQPAPPDLSNHGSSPKCLLRRDLGQLEQLARKLHWMIGFLLRIMRCRYSRIILECCR
jgi:hypothetical protein